MAYQRWKTFEQSVGVRKFKTWLRQHTGKEPVIGKDLDVKTSRWCGWDLIPEFLKKGDVLYAFGVSDDIGFERKACEAGANVFAFDPTPYCIDWMATQKFPEDHRFQFYPWAAAGQDGLRSLYPRVSNKGDVSSTMYTFEREGSADQEGIPVKMLTVSSMAAELGHTDVDVLKMDIEGAEYEVIDHLLASRFRPKMLLVEFHHRFKSIPIEKTRAAVRQLRKAGYLVAHVSVTNREVCLVHRRAMK